MSKKQPAITIYIPKEMGLSKEDVAKLKEVFQTQVADVMSAKAPNQLPIIPINTTSGPPVTPRASSPRKGAAGKSSKKGGTGSKKR